MIEIFSGIPLGIVPEIPTTIPPEDPFNFPHKYLSEKSHELSCGIPNET